MALSPKQLNELSAEDIAEVNEMEKKLDAYLLTLASISEVKFKVAYDIRIPTAKVNKRLFELCRRYKNAGWGEVDSGVMADGYYSITLREYKRHYQNHH